MNAAGLLQLQTKQCFHVPGGCESRRGRKQDLPLASYRIFLRKINCPSVGSCWELGSLHLSRQNSTAKGVGTWLGFPALSTECRRLFCISASCGGGVAMASRTHRPDGRARQPVSSQGERTVPPPFALRTSSRGGGEEGRIPAIIRSLVPISIGHFRFIHPCPRNHADFIATEELHNILRGTDAFLQKYSRGIQVLQHKEAFHIHLNKHR